MSPKTPLPMIATLLILGGTVFGVLGALHAVYTLLDLSNPRRLVPVDPSVAHAMANSALRLSGGRTDMWRAWVGFNFSHSLGDASRCVRALGRIQNQNAPGRHHHANIDPDRMRVSCSRPALLVPHPCSRRCHWHRLLRRRMGSVAKVTREGDRVIEVSWSRSRKSQPLGRW